MKNSATCICRKRRRVTTGMARSVPETVFSAKASSRSMLEPGNACGIFKAFIMVFGIMTFPARRFSPILPLKAAE